MGNQRVCGRSYGRCPIRRLRKALEPGGHDRMVQTGAVQGIVFQPAFKALLIGRRQGL